MLGSSLKSRHLGNTRAKTARIVLWESFCVVSYVRECDEELKQVFGKYLAVNTVSIRDAATLNFGDLNARARDPTTTSGLIN